MPAYRGKRSEKPRPPEPSVRQATARAGGLAEISACITVPLVSPGPGLLRETDAALLPPLPLLALPSIESRGMHHVAGQAPDTARPLSLEGPPLHTGRLRRKSALCRQKSGRLPPCML